MSDPREHPLKQDVKPKLAEVVAPDRTVQAPPPDEITLYDIYVILAGQKWLIAGIVSLFAGLALAIALLMTPVYRAEVVIAPVTERDGSNLSSVSARFGGLAELAGVSLPSSQGTAAENLVVLESRYFTEAFLREEGILPVLLEERWDPDAKTWRPDETTAMGRLAKGILGWLTGPPAAFPRSHEAEMMAAGFSAFDDIRTISEDKLTGMVTVAVEWRDPVIAARWTNSLIEKLNAHLRTRSIEEATRNRAYLDAKLKETNAAAMQQVLYSLIEDETKTLMLANAQEEFAFKILDPAVPPEKASAPKPILLIALSLFAGLFIGVGVALIRERLGLNSQKTDRKYKQNGAL